MRKSRFKKHRGAGVLFWRVGTDGKVEILLGLRSQGVSHAPGVWSTFGGSRDDIDDSVTDNALREGYEETTGRKTTDARLHGSFFPPQNYHFDPKQRARLFFPLAYDFTTFFVQVIRPNPGWPVRNWEHDELRWFGLKELPKPLHWEAMRVIAVFRIGLLFRRERTGG